MIETLSAWDRKLFLLINSWHAEWLNNIMVFFSGQLVWLPFILGLLWLAFKKLERNSFYLFILFLLLAVIASDVTSSYVLKNLVQRMRPCRLAELKPLINDFGQKCGGRFGFVSSHAANSFAILIFSFTVLKLKVLSFHLIWLLPLLVSYSRIYLGVHYPGDIAGGMLVGLGWGYFLARCFLSRPLGSKTA